MISYGNEYWTDAKIAQIGLYMRPELMPAEWLQRKPLNERLNKERDDGEGWKRVYLVDNLEEYKQAWAFDDMKADELNDRAGDALKKLPRVEDNNWIGGLYYGIDDDF